MAVGLSAGCGTPLVAATSRASYPTLPLPRPLHSTPTPAPSPAPPQIHKLLQGLLDQHRLAGQGQVLSMAEGMASYFCGRQARKGVGGTLWLLCQTQC